MTDLQAALAAALQDRYRLERELGRGGMAVVYLAEDLRHERPVALKVLLPELAAALGPERFQREIKLAARLQHPHILGVHDSGEAAGRLWFTMPFVEGESLRDRLRRERQLGVDDALRIGREVAGALDYAHRHGVIHRDIKPENILLTAEGDTLVADFGIARALAGDDHLTSTGLSVGTPAYMSPEQAAGDKAVDARTDVYSLAAVLYEMLAGEPPFAAPTAQAMVLRRLSEPAPTVRRARPNVPEAVDEAIRRALSAVPADRFATAAEFSKALGRNGAMAHDSSVSTAAAPIAGATVRRPAVPPFRRSAVLLGLGFLLGLGVLFAWRRSHADAGDTGGKVLAVLPFENLGDSADAYFADGVTEEVRGKLARLGGLAVIARNSSNDYRNTRKRPEEIARELGADYLLTATVRWSKAAGGPSRVRVTPELVDVRPGHAPRTRWQEPFDAALTDVFQVQADIAGKVASALDVTLGDTARRQLAAKPTVNLDAYDAYLQGNAAAGSGAGPASLRSAISFFERAVALDSGFVAAWSTLARNRSFLYALTPTNPALAAAAREAAERTRALAPDSPEAALALRSYYANVLQDNERALAAAESGLRRFPNDADLLSSAATAERALGRSEASVEHSARAMTLDPRSAELARTYGVTLTLLRRYAEARAPMERAVQLAPTSVRIRMPRAMVELGEGNLAGARAVIAEGLASIDTTALIAYFGAYEDLYWVLDDPLQERLLTLPPSAFDGDRVLWAMVRAQTHYLRGQRALARAFADTAERELAVQLSQGPSDDQYTAIRALALAYLGRKAEAIAEGRRAVERTATSTNGNREYTTQLLARTYLAVGEPEQALDQLEKLLKMTYYVSAAWLRIDPEWAALKGNPRFERLIAGS